MHMPNVRGVPRFSDELADNFGGFRMSLQWFRWGTDVKLLRSEIDWFEGEQTGNMTGWGTTDRLQAECYCLWMQRGSRNIYVGFSYWWVDCKLWVLLVVKGDQISVLCEWFKARWVGTKIYKLYLELLWRDSMRNLIISSRQFFVE